MPENERSRPAQHQAAANTVTSSDSTGRPWDEGVDWWSDPAYAYLRGLQDGARFVAELREDLRRLEAGSDAVHRDAVRQAREFIDAADRRAAHDAGEVWLWRTL